MKYAWLGFVTLVSIVAYPLWEATAKPENNSPTHITNQEIVEKSAKQQAKSSVEEISRKVTVRIITGSASGSGVIIERKGQSYTVLTCNHVFDNAQGGDYNLLTPDGRTHSVERLSTPALEEVDLALVQFSSEAVYQVVELGDRERLSLGQDIYVAGFPNYRFKSSQEVENTLNWGLRAFQFASGRLSMILSERSLPMGYKLGHTANIDNGMSGGPILDKKGRLIGINGRGKYPIIQGNDAFIFEDGSTPSREEIRRMESLSWAVPIRSFSTRIQEYRNDNPFQFGL
jgi:S1-C subfamily serine protease